MKSVTGSFVARLFRMTMKRKCVSRESRPSSLGHDRDQHLVFVLRENTQTRKAREAGPLADPL